MVILTTFEFTQALNYINKKIYEQHGTEDFFKFTDLDVPDANEVEKKMLEALHQRCYEKILERPPSFKEDFKIAILWRLNDAKDITVVLAHFTKAEMVEMEQKGFPILEAWRGFPLNFNNPKTTEMVRWLEAKILWHIDNNFAEFVMTRMRKFVSRLDYAQNTLVGFGFDEIKCIEIEIINKIDKQKQKGLLFGTHKDLKQNLPMTFNGLLITSVKMDNVAQHLEDMSLGEFFTRVRNSLYTMLGHMDNALKHSVDKDWTRNYIECLQRDKFYLDIAMIELENFQNEYILSGKTFSWQKEGK